MKLDYAWIFLFAVLGFLLYAAIAIKKEKITAKKNQKKFTLGNIIFNTPSWWSVFEEQGHRIQFHRTDTKYDWYALCEYLKNEEANLQSYVLQRLESELILFDEEATDITEQGDSVRIEGTATKDNETRLYLDVYAKMDGKDIYYFESRSSILNGCVEGPYFEDLIDHLEIQKDDYIV